MGSYLPLVCVLICCALPIVFGATPRKNQAKGPVAKGAGNLPLCRDSTTDRNTRCICAGTQGSKKTTKSICELNQKCLAKRFYKDYAKKYYWFCASSNYQPPKGGQPVTTVWRGANCPEPKPQRTRGKALLCRENPKGSDQPCKCNKSECPINNKCIVRYAGYNNYRRHCKPCEYTVKKSWTVEWWGKDCSLEKVQQTKTAAGSTSADEAKFQGSHTTQAPPPAAEKASSESTEDTAPAEQTPEGEASEEEEEPFVKEEEKAQEIETEPILAEDGDVDIIKTIEKIKTEDSTIMTRPAKVDRAKSKGE